MLEALMVLLVQLTGIDRTVDPNLAQLAEQRAATIECGSPEFYNHTGKPVGVAEILVCFSDPNASVQQAANAWMASASHRSVLTNPSLGRIGCGIHRDASGVMFACELANGKVPNTAAPSNAGWLTALGLLLVTLAIVVRKRWG